MNKRLTVLLAAGFLAACQSEGEVASPEADPGFPPRMGRLEAVLGDAAMVWDTYDFSVGAFDGSAWVGPIEGGARLTMTGYPEGNPQAESGLIRIVADYTGSPVAGDVPGLIRVEIYQTADRKGARLTSAGSEAALVLTAVERPEGEVYGQVGGTMTATLCPVAGEGAAVDRAACLPLSLTFATQIQYDGL